MTEKIKDLPLIHIVRSLKEGHLGGSVSWGSNFGSGRDLTVHEWDPRIGLYAVIVEPASDPLSSFLSVPPLLMLSLSLSLKTKQTFFKTEA